MNKIVKTYDVFLSEGFNDPTASVLNTPGMGNVSASSISDVTSVDEDEESADADQAKTQKMQELRATGDWMKPNGNYQNRGWLVHNYASYMSEVQSNTRFQVGQKVRCVSNEKESFGMVGKIIAFEDNTIRWEVLDSTTGVGQGAKQYRCHASELELAM